MSKFFSYVEIKTKITSIFPFAISLSYFYYLKMPLNVKATAVFFFGMFLFDLTTTSINNYIDSKKNNQILPYSRRKAKFILFLLLALSILFGFWLYLLTDLLILFVGGLCFLAGIFYTFGPLPINAFPWGEVLSGLFYGLLIPFILFYINMPKEDFLYFDISGHKINIVIGIIAFTHLLLLSLAPIISTANIMLANNICDLERDINVNRYTLPYYMGKKATDLYGSLYYISYLSNITMVIIAMLPKIFLLSLFTIIPVHLNVKTFSRLQTKDGTFITSIKNYILIQGGNLLALLISGIIMN